MSDMAMTEVAASARETRLSRCGVAGRAPLHNFPGGDQSVSDRRPRGCPPPPGPTPERVGKRRPPVSGWRAGRYPPRRGPNREPVEIPCFPVAISSASSAIFLSLGWSTGILRADRASARAEKSLILFQATPARPAWVDAAFHR